MESDLIASVKLRIQSVKGFFVKKQKLVFDGRELARYNSRVRDYGVEDGNVLYLVLRLSDLQAITVRTVCGKKLVFNVEKNKNMGYVKQQIAEKGQKYVDLKDQELVCDGKELEDRRLIKDICKNSDGIIVLLVRKSAKLRAKPIEKNFQLTIDALDLREIADRKGGHHSNEQVITREPQADFFFGPLSGSSRDFKGYAILEKLVASTFQGLERGNPPLRSSEGTGGAYFMQDISGQEYVSVFKPLDEEPMALNNPRGLPVSVDGQGMKRGTRVGEGAFREVAAYILDHPCSDLLDDVGIGFAGVPPTVMVRCLHRDFNYPEGFKFSSSNIKIGSLQMFVNNIGSCEDMGPRAFPVEEAHKISVLDIRLANADRHAGNILISKNNLDERIVLTPIDHGYCLPENFEDCTFEWLYWPQARQPYSSRTIDYILHLDAKKDIQLLKQHGWDLPMECARTLHISTMLLQKGVLRKLTPFTIGSMMCRETLKKESVIEQIVKEAEQAMLPGTSEEAFLESVSVIMDCYLDVLVNSNEGR
ncbi:hypothetical protein MLD38_015699 [Melastoma candidum]|uniref:Uncharacterized protein n=1 Tax=Melastoma candidum TaxID=119954 RepID=A0ACB9RH34_9MYRT|nr:hypothetical protein MLD38_015699 [Melastoma candidum]